MAAQAGQLLILTTQEEVSRKVVLEEAVAEEKRSECEAGEEGYDLWSVVRRIKARGLISTGRVEGIQEVQFLFCDFYFDVLMYFELESQIFQDLLEVLLVS